MVRFGVFFCLCIYKISIKFIHLQRDVIFVDCPLGYFGYNCSQTCLPPHYGNFCTQKCEHDCQECHHRDGCTPRNKTMGILNKDN